MNKIIGKVTESERNEIQAIYERRNGLCELTKIIDYDDSIYEKLVADFSRTNAQFQEWWDKMALKYNWERVHGAHWSIDFKTCEIHLEKEDN